MRMTLSVVCVCLVLCASAGAQTTQGKKIVGADGHALVNTY